MKRKERAEVETGREGDEIPEDVRRQQMIQLSISTKKARRAVSMAKHAVGCISQWETEFTWLVPERNEDGVTWWLRKVIYAPFNHIVGV